jgi:DNA-binding MarR family transcriptional regulator
VHPITFGVKRLFLRSVAITRTFTREHDRLTPARFDMLVAIARGVTGIVQFSVRKQLDVRSPTVSRMMRSLELLGYVRRQKYPPDRRHRWVTLTAKGRTVIDDAQADLTFGPFGESVARALVSRRPDERAPTERSLAKARTLLRTMRELAGDTALLRYPSYLPSGRRSPRYPVPYAGEHPAWMVDPPRDARRAADPPGSTPGS